MLNLDCGILYTVRLHVHVCHTMYTACKDCTVCTHGTPIQPHGQPTHGSPLGRERPLKVQLDLLAKVKPDGVYSVTMAT